MYVCIYLAAPGLSCGMRGFCCSMWDLVPRPEIKARPPALGAWSLNNWTTREVPFKKKKKIIYLAFAPKYKQ